MPDREAKIITPITYGGAIFCLAVFSLLLSRNDPLFNRYLLEDGIVEYAGFACLLIAGIFLIRSGSRWLRSTRITGACLILTGMIFIVTAGEEISWGQRIIGFDTPDSLARINSQNEFNLHNIRKSLVDRSVRYLIAGFALLGLLCAAAKKHSVLGLRLPDRFVFEAYALSGIYQPAPTSEKSYVLSLVTLSLSLILGLAARNRPWVLTSVVSLGIASLVTWVNWNHQDKFGSNAAAEVREFLFALISLGYALSLTRSSQPEYQSSPAAEA